VAVDAPIDLRDVQVLGQRNRKATLVLGGHGVQTVYLGSRKSKHQLRIYNKGAERMEKGDAEVELPMTRFEVQLRGRPGGGPLPLLRLPQMGDPFCGLRVYLPRTAGLPLPRRLLVEWGRLFGLPALKPELSRREFQDLLRDYDEAGPGARLPHPSEVYAARWEAAALDLLADLGLEAAP
jgi:hypothetical protein